MPIYVFRQTEIYCPQLVTHFRANVRRILDYRLKFDYSEACLKMRLDLRDSFMWLSWNYYQISLMVQSRKNKFYNMVKPTQIETNWWVCYVTYVDIYMGVRIKVTAAWYETCNECFVTCK